MLSVMLTAGCGGGGGGSDVSQPAAEEPPAAPPPGLLIPVTSAEEFGDSLRNALEGSEYLISTDNRVFALEDADGLVPALSFANKAAAGGTAFSGTTLQETGVDEADLVKYDGEHMFVVDTPAADRYYAKVGIAELFVPEDMVAPPTSVRILSTDPASSSVTEVGRIELSDDRAGSVNGLYLQTFGGSDQLIAVSQNNPFVYWELFASDYYWQNGNTLIQSFDVTDVTAVAPGWSIGLQGSLLASRRIDNTLYVVTRYSPSVPGVISYPQTDEQIAKNRELVAGVTLEELMPDAIINEGAPIELVDGGNCYIPNVEYEGLPVPPVTGTLVTITAIDLTAPENMSSTCLNAYTSGFYSSTDAIYLTASGSDQTTLIHKFALGTNGAEYRGSGSVPGYIGTRNPSFLMGEHDGVLRVVSSTWNNRFFPLPVAEIDADTNTTATADNDETELTRDLGRHRLTVLRESETETALETIASLPNDANPAHIGKPGEDIYSVRYLENRGYIVTFQVIDPLYVLDLTEPANPVIAGELEIPGYSTLLQPLGENLLLGVGQSVHEELPNSLQGVKMEVFDVADISAPVSMGTVEIGRRGSYSPALDDHHALTLLQTEDGYRATIPVQRHEAPNRWGGDPVEDPWYYYDWSDTGLYMFDVDGATGELSAAGALIVEQPSKEFPYSQSNLYRSRGVLHDDAVYFVHDGKVWSGTWGDSDSVAGPK